MPPTIVAERDLVGDVHRHRRADADVADEVRRRRRVALRVVGGVDEDVAGTRDRRHVGHDRGHDPGGRVDRQRSGDTDGGVADAGLGGGRQEHGRSRRCP